MVETRPDLGLANYIKRHNPEVTRRTIDTFTALELNEREPIYQIDETGKLIETGKRGITTTALLSNGSVIGVKRIIPDFGSYHVTLPSAGEIMWGFGKYVPYDDNPEGFYTGVLDVGIPDLKIAAFIDMEEGDKELLEALGEPKFMKYKCSEFPLLFYIGKANGAPSDIAVEYQREGDIFVPRTIQCGQRWFEQKGPGKWEEHGSWTVDALVTRTRYESERETRTVIMGEDGLWSTSREYENGRATLEFPPSLDYSKVQELEKILMTDVDWVRLPEHVPLQYTRRAHKPDNSSPTLK